MIFFLIKKLKIYRITFPKSRWLNWYRNMYKYKKNRFSVDKSALKYSSHPLIGRRTLSFSLLRAFKLFSNFRESLSHFGLIVVVFLNAPH